MFSLLTELELPFLYWMQAMHTPFLDWFMPKVTFLGEVGWFWLVTGAVLLCVKKTRKTGIAMLLSIFIGFLLGNVFLKNLVERQRPCWIDPAVQLLVASPRDFSFPSGHSLVSFEGAVSILLYHKKWGIGALVLAFLIAVSRLYLFVHFPSDVIVGSLMGVVIAWAVHRLVQKILAKP